MYTVTRKGIEVSGETTQQAAYRMLRKLGYSHSVAKRGHITTGTQIDLNHPHYRTADLCIRATDRRLRNSGGAVALSDVVGRVIVDRV